MAIVGGTASKLGGGKFSNGAVSGAFVHMFNAEWRVSVSASGGAGTGGTLETGITISHDSTKPWYTGWKIGSFTTEGVGGYAGADAGGEICFGTSSNNDISALKGTSVTVGGSADIPITANFLNVGYETVLSNTAEPLHTFSFGAYGNPFVPGEAHTYITETQVNTWASW